MVYRYGALRLLTSVPEIGADLCELPEVVFIPAEIDAEFFAQVFFQLMALVEMVNCLDGLFEADGDEEPDGDRGDVDNEIAPGSGGVVRRMDVEHQCWRLLWNGRRFWRRIIGRRCGQRRIERLGG
jgi:hypothetical protein